ncbi:MAG: hypothetical protein WBW79_09705 [Desulfocapsaceae bacterium]
MKRKTSGRYRTIAGFHLFSLSPADLERLYKTTREFSFDRLRFTPSGQIAVSGLSDADFTVLSARLQTFMRPLPASGLASIYSCAGCSGCSWGIEDTETIARAILELEYPEPMPARLKIAVAGCPRCCTMPRLRDVGLFPTASGWNLSFGGNGGSQPRIGDIIGRLLDAPTALNLMQKALSIYQLEARPGQRTAAFVEQCGIEYFKKSLKK